MAELLVVLGFVTFAVVVAILATYLMNLRQELQREKEALQLEIASRQKAEKQANAAVQKFSEIDGYKFKPMGIIHSCFPHRRGTPRQANVVPTARGKIMVDRHISPATIENLDEYSHLWIIFIFHENTNKANPKGNDPSTTFKAKIFPPRAQGKSVGVYATRTPHRPNPIGLSLVKMEGIDLKRREITVSGLDLVEGTPVLDIKPYIPQYDSVGLAPTQGTTFPGGWRAEDVRLPRWVGENEHDQGAWTISFTAEAEQQLALLVEYLEFYSSFEEVKKAIVDVLAVDNRSFSSKVHGPTHEEELRLDCLVVAVVVHLDQHAAIVQSITHSNPRAMKKHAFRKERAAKSSGLQQREGHHKDTPSSPLP